MNFLRKVDNHQNTGISGMNHPSYIQNPNDRAEIYMTKGGRSVITKIQTSRGNATLREYIKKDGTPGKKTLLIKER